MEVMEKGNQGDNRLAGDNGLAPGSSGHLNAMLCSHVTTAKYLLSFSRFSY